MVRDPMSDAANNPNSSHDGISIYLASPYSHPEAYVMEQRFQEVCRIAGELMISGHIVFSPIAHSHPIAVQSMLPGDWKFWEKFDRAFIAVSQKLVVAMMDGWRESKGVTAEIAFAKEIGIPVEYMEVSKVCEFPVVSA